MLKIKDLSYRYQSRKEFTLKNVDLEMGSGEFLLLAGRSGCGKSTLIKAISGLLGDQDRGELKGSMTFEGEDITQASPEHIGMLVGTVYQSPDDQLFAMTVADEVAFALENRGVEPEVIKATVKETLELVGLGGLENNSIHQLSGGQRQRLALASILVTKPKLLILDEPVSQMNPAGVKAFMELLLKLKREANVGVLMIEHRVNELYNYFPRLAVMRQGRIIYDGATAEAWTLLAELEKQEATGLREPQNVKLCKLLGLSKIIPEDEAVAKLLLKERTLNRTYIPEPKTLAKGEAQVELQHVSYTYPGVDNPTLPDVTLALYPHQITALMGFNGAGKSTLLNMLGGLTKQNKGTITLGGKALRDQLDKVGYLRQEPDLMLLADTVREELLWKNKLLDEAGLDVMLEKLHLTEYKEDFPLALSKGQRLRVVLGAMLAKKPQLLLLDEPTTGQDESSLSEIRQLLLDFKAEGGSIFICTHDIELASQIADRVVVLKEGNIIADASANTILSNEELLEQGGLATPPMLSLSKKLGLPPCITLEEVCSYVR